MPNKNNNRMGRIDEEYRKELSQIIGFELKNSSITGMISVTKVKVTPDLKYAKVYVSIFCNDEEEKKTNLAALKGASGFIRKTVGQKINLRHCPEILIELDDSINYGMHMDELIQKISSKK